MNTAFLEYFRCPEDYDCFTTKGELSPQPGYFRLGERVVCYARISVGPPAGSAADQLLNISGNVETRGSDCLLPFDPDEAADNLRMERYAANAADKKSLLGRAVRVAYYLVRPLLPVKVRRRFQRAYLKGWEQIAFPQWPVDFSVDMMMRELAILSIRARGVDRLPFIWFWPDGHRASAIMTHDVETTEGRDFCGKLMDINDEFNIKSSFQIIPEKRYEVPREFIDSIKNRGFEVNLHGLNHDGHLFDNRDEFLRRARRINEYAAAWEAKGFRSPVLYRNQEWFSELSVSYDMSVPNVAHLDPQRGGCCTVMPYLIDDIVELPLTATQDYSLFNVLNDFSTDLWERQIDSIMQNNGLASFIVHPDYILEPRAREVYRGLLAHLRTMRDECDVWTPLPRDVAAWWRQRSKLKLIRRDGNWRIEGDGGKRARTAFARVENSRLVFEIES